MTDPDSDQEVLPESVDNAITTAYYSRGFSMPDTVRARAQVAFSTATVIGSGLLAAGVFSRFVDASAGFHAAGIAILVLWLVASGLSIWAVTVSYTDPEQGTSDPSAVSWAKGVVAASLAERKKVLFWQRAGTYASLVALAGTILLFGWWLAAPSYATVSMRLVLTKTGRGTYARLCGVRTPRLTAVVFTKSLDADQLEFVPVQPRCHKSGGAIELPRIDVAATTTGPLYPSRSRPRGRG